MPWRKPTAPSRRRAGRRARSLPTQLVPSSRCWIHATEGSRDSRPVNLTAAATAGSRKMFNMVRKSQVRAITARSKESSTQETYAATPALPKRRIQHKRTTNARQCIDTATASCPIPCGSTDAIAGFLNLGLDLWLARSDAGHLPLDNLTPIEAHSLRSPQNLIL